MYSNHTMAKTTFITVKGKATFRGRRRWSSHNAWAQFGVKGNGKIWCEKTYFQLEKHGEQRHVNPWFKPAEWKRMKKLALDKSQNQNGNSALPDVREATSDRPHEQDLCERCQELGMPCNGLFFDVCDKGFIFSRRAVRARRRRLSSGQVMTLYHQTSPQIAQCILETQTMKPGRQGLAGGGIYFAKTPEHTYGKAQQTGVILECQVQLGELLVLGPKGDSSMNIEKLINEYGCDSVKINRDRPEWVVYMSDQVINVSRYMHGGH
eukprot:m.10893 g.10893  ORF g.10893 m.10893 type:complete len:265 (-) comp5630_c0_seq1:264-1058(-)